MSELWHDEVHRVVLTELNKVDSVDSVDPRVAEVDRSPWPRGASFAFTKCMHLAI